MATASCSDVSGPVATMPGRGNSGSSIVWEKTSRSTTSALPPGTRAWSAAARRMLPSERSSAFSNPRAFAVSSDLNELLQTNSANRPV